MDQRLADVLGGAEANYILPFLWQHEGNRAILRDQVRLVRQSGVKAFCVEARPHENFCGQEWWEDMEVVLSEAEALGMQVWILDDKHFPTGYANGLVPKKYPERRKWQLIEHHVDMMGPMQGASLLLPTLDEENLLVGAVAYPRKEFGEALINEPIDITAHVHGRFLYWDVPEGCWRVFFFIQTRKHTAHSEYIHMIDPESVKVQIEAVYETHYQRLGRYFGKTLVGFFSDEPSLGNAIFRHHVPNMGMYEMKIGMVGLALPWSGELMERMETALGRGAVKQLAGLWYPLGGESPGIRFAYMDIVTRMYRDHFTRQLGRWCKDHGVLYIGHIIEDMNAHGRLGCSGGHYFRSLDGQDMSGIDIVLHQIMPGFGQYKSSAITAGGVADPEFFHYVLAKLGSSMAHINERAAGRAMCEVFGAYGWAEGAPMMKWLMDHLIVRGINHFVPHAFSPKFPDPDCPPHFGGGGRDPQFAGFSKLMGYVNRVTHLLHGGVHITSAAILYHAESEWMNSDDCMLTQKPARALYDAHIDYDILPMDTLAGDASVSGGKLRVLAQTYDCLIVPRAPLLPEPLIAALNRLQAQGLAVFYVDGAPLGIAAPQVVPLASLVSTLRYRGMEDVTVKGDYPLLRVLHVRRGAYDFFMLFNESIVDAVRTQVGFPCKGRYARMDLLNEDTASGETADGYIDMTIEAYESVLIAFGPELPGANQALPQTTRRIQMDLLFDIDTCDQASYPAFSPYEKAVRPHNLTAPDAMPGFSGVMRYTATLDMDGPLPDSIDLGMVGLTSQLTLNGKDLGLRICNPYRYDVRGIIKPGQNTLVIEVGNTLVQEVKDVFSTYVQIPPSGLMGPITLCYS